MFFGSYSPKLDDKGRFFLPSRLRDELVKGLFIAPYYDFCLAIYPMETFQEMAKKIAAMPASVSKVRAFQRQMAGDGSAEIPDKQGRVHIPPKLRAYAHLDGEILVRGVMDRIELWNPKLWEEHSAGQQRIYADMDEEIWPSS